MPDVNGNMDLLIFGDQATEQSDTLRSLCAHEESSILRTFLCRATTLLREEITQVTRSERPELPFFRAFQQLLDAYYTKGSKDVRIESFLLVVAQLGQYML